MRGICKISEMKGPIGYSGDERFVTAYEYESWRALKSPASRTP